MSYEREGGLFDYFAPIVPLATTDAGVMQEIDIGAASADHGEWSCFRPCTMKEAFFALTSELAGGTSAAPTVLFKKRPTPLSATGETTAATLTIPDTTAVGKTVSKKVDVDFAVGDALELSHTIGTGTPTGIGVAYAVFSENQEELANNTDQVASA